VRRFVPVGDGRNLSVRCCDDEVGAIPTDRWRSIEKARVDFELLPIDRISIEVQVSDVAYLSRLILVRCPGGEQARTAPDRYRQIVGVKPAELRTVLYDLPLPTTGGRPRQIDPNPMSSREVDVLRRLARGMVYKQIASELGLSTSTVRTHLHNVYGKLGAMDRAQAVLMATERGWI